MKQRIGSKFSSVLVVVTALGLAACQATGPVEQGGEVGFASNSADCGAVDLQYLIGQPLSVFEAMGHKGTTRIIRPGDAVTMDYRPERLNVKVNDRGRITSFQCN
ncbi:I78 family peptidase inhibitor [Aliiroseovarius crassostreae]|uniref:I78 family peptidase inhibitor n=1 Tax=Aliiroseovarius crassostreae TaxID=154981 RepID=UPI00220BDB2A|nr:I78 family peptidase inhibitor [Aliiroseovarius crassostreae]UWP88559.1 hypothetical protein K3J57_11740 [Aliiroseovarius crassostreae]UWP98029.1 hypothetical protein K3X53_11715 [Aliiroseovarius crassostreae]UWQ01213.1 hypothetical protein K3X44_12020 [Aliiroseovarius crassostreae]